MFTWRSVRDANLARKIKKVLFSTSDRGIVWIFEGRLIANAPISCKGLTAANKIFGTELNALKGKTVSHKNSGVQVEIASVPVAIIGLY